MGVDGHGRFVVSHNQHHAGCFAPHAGQGQQGLHRVWYHAIKIGHQFPGHAHQGFGFVVGVGDAFNQGQQIFRLDTCHGQGCGVNLEQTWRGHIHPLVCALGRENHGHQQFKRIAEMQLGLRYWHMFVEPVKNVFVACLSVHGLISRFELLEEANVVFGEQPQVFYLVL